jgi:hypothetical protein
MRGSGKGSGFKRIISRYKYTRSYWRRRFRLINDPNMRARSGNVLLNCVSLHDVMKAIGIYGEKGETVRRESGGGSRRKKIRQEEHAKEEAEREGYREKRNKTGEDIERENRRQN